MGDKKVDDQGYVYERDGLSGEYRRKEAFWGNQVRETDAFGQPQKGQRAETWWGGEVKSGSGRPLYEPKGGGASGDILGNATGNLLGCLLGLVFAILFYWIRFCWRKPKIGLPITAVLLIVLYFSLASGQRPVTAWENPAGSGRSSQSAVVNTRPPATPTLRPVPATRTPAPTKRLPTTALTATPTVVSLQPQSTPAPNTTEDALGTKNAPPAPRVISVQTIPERVAPGQPFRARIEATNDGGTTVDGYINVSSPENASLTIISHSAVGAADSNYGSCPHNLRIIRGGKNAPAHLCQGATLHNNGSDGGRSRV
jgi:hypothetical protein